MAGESINPIGYGKEIIPATQLQRGTTEEAQRTTLNTNHGTRELETGKNISKDGSGGSNGGERPTSSLATEKAIKEKGKKVLSLIFNYLVTPISFASAFTSLGAFFRKDSDFLEKASSILNKLGYFINGFHGSFKGALTNDLTGTVGYGLVSLASIIGNSENMYYLKGWGSATDQLPAVNEDIAYHDEIKKSYGLKDGEEENFKKYTSFWDNVKKTCSGVKVVCSDIFEEFNKKKREGVFKALWDIFVKDKRRAERNIVASSFGMYFGSFLGIFPKVRTVGQVIRDIFGAHADLGLFAKGSGMNKAGNKVGSNLKYMICGVLYELGSLTDLVYRLTKMDRLHHVAVGLDNAGFWFMNWAYGSDREGK